MSPELNPKLSIEVFMTSKTGLNCNPPKVKVDLEKVYSNVLVSHEDGDEELNFQRDDLIKILEFLKDEEVSGMQTIVTYGSQPSLIVVYPFNAFISKRESHVKHKTIVDALVFLKDMKITSPYIRYVESIK